MDTTTKCILAGVAAAGIYMLWPSSADAQNRVPCEPLAQAREMLKTKYNEVEVGGGFVNESVIATLFASPGGATWTMLAVGTNGMACFMSAGTDWFAGSLPEDGEGA